MKAVAAAPPAQDILIHCLMRETRVAVIENEVVQELHIERTAGRGLVGNVYLGRVARVLPGLQSAFIDIGLERAAFLHLADLPATPRLDRATPIEARVFEGQPLVVQVVKDPSGGKGARLTMQIGIAGRLLVLLPQDDQIGVSQKIPADRRAALRSRLALLAAPERGGFILRTNAEEASDAELAADIAYLRRVWTRIAEQAKRQPPKSLLHQELDLPARVLRDLVGDATRSVQVDARETFERLLAFGREFMPAAAVKLQHHRGEQPILARHSVDDEIEKALARRVELGSGGYLVIDQTEALTTVDVNTGGFTGARNFDDTVLRTNLEAARATARQLRLRNLGGIVIVDFIDMTRADHGDAVLDELRKHLARDHVKTTVVGGFSPLGLVELTRRRSRESLAQQLCEPCPVCHGRGHVKTARTVADQILREVLSGARRSPSPRELRVVASPRVIDLLRGEASPDLAELSDLIGRPISLDERHGARARAVRFAAAMTAKPGLRWTARQR